MRLVLPLFVLALALVGCERTKPIVQIDAGSACEAGEQLVNGQCRFVCNRDGDCPAGQRCNLLTGACEQRPPPVDSGVVMIPCTEGAVRCSVDSTAVERCDATGAFVVDTQCPQPEGYCQNERCLTCRPGATKCGAGGGSVERCADDGNGYLSTTCATGASCVMGECRECNPGQKRCSADGQTLEECQRLPRPDLTYGYQPAGDNFDGACVTQVCEVVSGTAQCRAPDCLPGAQRCLNPATQQVCSATGSWSDVTCSSLPGFGANAECVNGVCIDECADAVRARSYFGCEYWAMALDNSMDTLFRGRSADGGLGVLDSDYVFVVTNQSALPATVEVWRHQGGAPVRVKTVTVPGKNDPATSGLMKIPVPWQAITPPTAATGTLQTGRARIGYRLTSTRPITAYQFNPIDAVKVTNRTCTANAGDADCACNEYGDWRCTLTFLGSCLSCDSPGQCVQTTAGKRCSYGTFSNDASLLLPAHILGDAYVAVTPGHSHISQPGSTTQRSSQLAVLATQDDTRVTVRASAVTLAGGGITAMAVNETRVFTLQSYEVLSLASATAGSDIECQNYSGNVSWCRKANDLTGTVITTTSADGGFAPVAVFGGNPCLNIPYSRPYCDHVEEQIFPFTTWGQSFIAVPSSPFRLNNNNIPMSAAVPDHFKIVAGAPVTLTLTPPPTATNVVTNNCLTGTSLQANTCQLAGGSYVEFKSFPAFRVQATAPIAVAQFLPGQGQVTGAPTDPQQGDPSMILLPPIEQWRTEYTVLASTGLKDNYLGLAIDGARVQEVRVDGTVVPLTAFAPIPNTSFRVRNHPVSTGTHTVRVTPLPGQTTLPGAGVTVYGYDAQVSYGYTGGLDLTTIVTGVNPGG